MVAASLLTFARTGVLGPIRRGLTRAKVRAHLGGPPSWSLDGSEHRAAIWTFGDVELHFADDVVDMLFCDAGALTRGCEALSIDPWVVRRGLPQAAFERAVEGAGMVFERRLGFVGQVHIVVHGASLFAFDEGQDGVVGLRYWQTARA